MKKGYLTIAELAEYSSVSERALRELCDKKKPKLKHRRFGRKILVKVQDFDEFMDTLTLTPHPLVGRVLEDFGLGH